MDAAVSLCPSLVASLIYGTHCLEIMLPLKGVLTLENTTRAPPPPKENSFKRCSESQRSSCMDAAVSLCRSLASSLIYGTHCLEIMLPLKGVLTLENTTRGLPVQNLRVSLAGMQPFHCVLHLQPAQPYIWDTLSGDYVAIFVFWSCQVHLLVLFICQLPGPSLRSICWCSSSANCLVHLLGLSAGALHLPTAWSIS